VYVKQLTNAVYVAIIYIIVVIVIIIIFRTLAHI